MPIELDNIDYSYDKKSKALSGINLSIGREDITCIVGHNGSGKTTLGKIIMGMLDPDKGHVTIDNKGIVGLGLGEISREVGYLFQNPELQLFALNVWDELAFPYRLEGKLDDAMLNDIDDILTTLDLMGIKDKQVHKLSYGEKQRLAIGTILMREPKYIILDEPTTGLDNIRRQSLSKILDDISKRGIGLIIISHDMEFVKKHYDRLIRLSGGKVIEDRRKS